MKSFILICVSFVLVNAHLQAQNIECIGNSIKISIKDYKIGNIQWQFSANGLDWIDIEGEKTTGLTYTIIESGYFRAKVTYGDCDFFADSLKIETYPLPTISLAGSDQYILTTDTTVNLSANTPVFGTGKWSIVSGGPGSFADDTVSTTTFIGSPCKDYVFVWIITSGCKESSDSLSIGFHAEPTTADAGTDQYIISADTSVVLSSNTPATGKGKWSIVSGGNGSFADETLPTTIFTGSQCNDYILAWTISTECKTSSDRISIGFHAEPSTANAGTDQYIISTDTSALLNANLPDVGKGKWSIVSGSSGSFADDTMASTIFTGIQCNDYVLRWTISTPCSVSSDDILVGFHSEPDTAVAGTDQYIITTDTTAFLSANFPVAGTGKWSIVSGGTGSFAGDTIPSTTFTGSQCNDYVLRWTISFACSVSSDDILVGFHPEPTIAEAGVDQYITGADSSAFLVANTPVIGKGKWSLVSGSQGIFANDTIPSTTFTGFQCNDYVLRWTVSTVCGESSDDVRIGFHAEPTIANAGENIISPDSVVTLSANTPDCGTGKWTVVSGTGGIFENENLPTTKFTCLGNTSYVLRWTISTECGQSYDDVFKLFQ